MYSELRKKHLESKISMRDICKKTGIPTAWLEDREITHGDILDVYRDTEDRLILIKRDLGLEPREPA